MLVNPLPYNADIMAPLDDRPVRDKLPYKDCRNLVDADMFVYAAGFSVEHSEPIAFDAEGRLIGQWRNKQKYNEWCKKHPDKAELVAELDFEEWIEEFSKCEFILRNKKKQILEVTRRAKQSWFLTKGSTLWRNEDATIQEYKGNRKEMRKPIYYDECRAFMEEKFRAKVCRGLEADDSVAHTARENVGSVIVTSGDKDLLTIPGYHLNPSKMGEGVFYTTPLEACRNLYIQMLMGDRIDNIKGLSGDKEHPGWGIKTATKAINQFITEYDMAKFVAEQYAKEYPDGTISEDGTTLLSWQEMLCETANLLFLRRYQDVRFTWEK